MENYLLKAAASFVSSFYPEERQEWVQTEQSAAGSKDELFNFNEMSSFEISFWNQQFLKEAW